MDPVRRTAVFDYGGVLTHPVKRSIDAWLARDSVDPASLTRLLREWLARDAAADNPLHQLERGERTEADFSRAMAERLKTTDGSNVSPDGLLARFFQDLAIDDAMVQLVRDLRAAGVTTVLLSNSWGPEYPWALIDELFDHTVISSHVGMRKPEARIFELTAERAGTTVGELVFVDDGAPNVEAARALGITAHLHTEAGQTRDVLSHSFPGAHLERLDTEGRP